MQHIASRQEEVIAEESETSIGNEQDEEAQRMGSTETCSTAQDEIEEQIASTFSAKLATNIRLLIEENTYLALKQARAWLRFCKSCLDGFDTFSVNATEDKKEETSGGILSNPALRLVSLCTLGMAIWFSVTGKSKEKKISPDYYPLPTAIEVEETTLPYQQIVKDTPANTFVSHSAAEKTKVIYPHELDLSGDFEIVTDRYRVIKEKDFFLSRVVGHVASVPAKIFFWDFDVGLGLDENRTKAVLSMLENNKEINGLTVRINNNGVLHDTCRLFFDEEVCERNNFVARVFIGIPTTFFGEMFQELRRGDYYNPMTQTVALYSDVSSIAAHEMGHHVDFQRFDQDWMYTMTRAYPPAMLYQEWQASWNAKGMIDQQDGYQFYRHLLPAFATYLVASYYLSKNILRKFGDGREVTPDQTLRHMATSNAQLHAGICAYSAMIAAGAPMIAGAAGFGAAFIGTQKIANHLLRDRVRYNHEY